MYAVVAFGKASRYRLLPGCWCHAVWKGFWQDQFLNITDASAPAPGAASTHAVAHLSICSWSDAGAKLQFHRAASSCQAGHAFHVAQPFQSLPLLTARSTSTAAGSIARHSSVCTVPLTSTQSAPQCIPSASFTTPSRNSTADAHSIHVISSSVRSSSSSSSSSGVAEGTAAQGSSCGGSKKGKGKGLPTWLCILKRKRRQRERLKVQAGVERRSRRAGAAAARPIKLDPYQPAGGPSGTTRHSGQPRPPGKGGSASGRVWAMDARELTAAITRVTSLDMMARLLQPLLAVQEGAEVEATQHQGGVLQIEGQGGDTQLQQSRASSQQQQQQQGAGSAVQDQETSPGSPGSTSSAGSTQEPWSPEQQHQQQTQMATALSRKDGLRVRAAQLAIVRAGNTLNGVQLTAALYSLVRLAGQNHQHHQQHQYHGPAATTKQGPQVQQQQQQQQQLVHELHSALCRELALGGAQRLDARGVSAAVWCLGKLSVSQGLDPTPDAWASLVQRLLAPSHSSLALEFGRGRRGRDSGDSRQHGRGRPPKVPGLLLLPPAPALETVAHHQNQQLESGTSKRSGRFTVSTHVGLSHQELVDLAAGLAWLRAGPADVWCALARAVLACCSASSPSTSSSGVEGFVPAGQPTTAAPPLSPHHLAHLLTSLKTGQALLIAQADMQAMVVGQQQPQLQDQQRQEEQQEGERQDQGGGEPHQASENNAPQYPAADHQPGHQTSPVRTSSSPQAQNAHSASTPSQPTPGSQQSTAVAALLTPEQLSELAAAVVQGMHEATLQDLAMSLTALESLGLVPPPASLVEAAAQRVCSLLGRRGTWQNGRSHSSRAGTMRRVLFKDEQSHTPQADGQAGGNTVSTLDKEVLVSPRDAKALRQWFNRDATRKNRTAAVNPALRLLKKAARLESSQML